MIEPDHKCVVRKSRENREETQSWHNRPQSYIILSGSPTKSEHFLRGKPRPQYSSEPDLQWRSGFCMVKAFTSPGALHALLHLIFPSDCAVCRTPLRHEGIPFICQACWTRLSPLPGPCCPQCGQP
ncbi:MAG: double zinc ribbon domain-containing protein, partial [Nitrospirales bacterium]